MKSLFTLFVLSAALTSFRAQAQCTIVLSGTVTDASCFGGFDGLIDLNITGGTPPYMIQWSNGITLTWVTGVADTYPVTVTDANNCTATDTFTINEPPPLELDVVIDSSTLGTWTVNTVVTGGVAPYTYAWSNGDVNSSITNDAVYFMDGFTITVTDANGCTVEGMTYASAAPCGIMFTTTYDTVSNTFYLAVDSTIQNSFSATAVYDWSFGDGTNSSQQFPSHSYAANDVYNVCLFISESPSIGCGYCRNIGIDSLGNVYTRVDQSGFSMQVVPYNFTGTTHAHSSGFGFDIHPNPVSDVATLRFVTDQASECVVEIFDLIGQRVHAEVYNPDGGNNILKISLEDLDEGFYVLTLETKEGKASRPFIRR